MTITSSMPARRLVLAIGLAFYLDAATAVVVAVALPVWRAAFELGPWQLGVLGGGLTLATAMGSFLGGRLGDRVGLDRVFAVDLLVFAAGVVVLLIAHGPVLLTIGVLTVGLAAGADVPIGLAILSRPAFGGRRGRLAGTTQVMWIAAILVTYGLASAVSRLQLGGVRILLSYLVVLAVTTIVLRRRIGLSLSAENANRERNSGAPAGPDPGDRSAVPKLAAFFLCWSLAATSLGNYGTYFLVGVTKLSQGAATGLVLVTFLPALGMALLFTRLADTPWRDRVFRFAAGLQVLAFGLGASTGGTVVTAMCVAIVLYSLSNVFAGEAIYKTWSQYLLAERGRATILGNTYAAVKVTAGTFMLVVPALISTSPTLLLSILTACVALSGTIGAVITRDQRL